MIKDILRDGFYYLVSKSIVGILSISVIWLSLRLYGFNIYGEYSVLYALTLTISNLCFTWLAQSYIRMCTKGTNNNYVTRVGFVYSFFICILIFSLVSFITKYNYFLCMLLAVSNGIYCIGRSILQSRRNIKKFFYFDLSRILVQLIFAYLFSFIFNDFKGLVYATSLSCIVFLITFKTFWNGSKQENYKQDLWNWVKFGAPVALWLTIASGQLLLDRKIISAYLPLDDLGTYSAVYDSIVRICALVVIPLSNACYPILVSNEAQNLSYRKLGFYMSAASLTIALFIASTVYFSYGFMTSYINILMSRDSLSFLIFGIVLWQLGMLYQKPLEMQNNTPAMLLNIIICLVISGVINIFYVGQLGLGIFPVTVSISSVIYLILTFLWIKK